MKTPKRHYEPKLSLYLMKFEDAVEAIAKPKPELKKHKQTKSTNQTQPQSHSQSA